MCRWRQLVACLYSCAGRICPKASTFDEATYKKNAASSAPAKKKEEKQEKPAKAASSKSKKKEADEEEEVDEIAAAEPKFVDPFGALPNGKFSMDAFKRCYSNEDTLTKAIPFFWEHFDPEHYSIWYAEYKFPQELTMTFMSCNLISGMFQRLEKLKKNAFASVCLFGTNNDSSISGLWIWKGHDLAFTMSPDWQVDYESYDWKKLDASDPATQTLVKEYFMWKETSVARNSTRAKSSMLKLAVEKKRKFRETIELQVSLKNYDPQKTSVPVELSNSRISLPKLKVCVLGDQQHIDEAAASEIPYMSADDLKKLNKDKKMIKNLARATTLHCLRVFDQANSTYSRSWAQQGWEVPSVVTHNETLSSKIDEIRATVKFQMKKVLCLSVAIGHVEMTQEELVANISLGINFLVSLLKKNWQNVRALNIKSTMGPAQRLY
uniref:EF-1-gamma C-terminal domain-containing protein n=1 Tax=Ditylenchus dipsaci TaxID=166011 RepID=A0A915DSF4_9BILA